MQRKSSSLLAFTALAVLAALVAIGRWEGNRQTDLQKDGIAAVRADVGALTAHTLSAYRYSPTYECLDYRRGTRRYALELCFDQAGHVLEASDRRETDSRVYSLRFDPGAASVMLPVGQARAAVDKLRSSVVPGIWLGVLRNMRACAGFAHSMGDSLRAARGNYAPTLAGCLSNLESVGTLAHQGRDAGAKALAHAAEAFDTILREYVDVLGSFQPRLFGSKPVGRRALPDLRRQTAELLSRALGVARQLSVSEPTFKFGVARACLDLSRRHSC